MNLTKFVLSILIFTGCYLGVPTLAVAQVNELDMQLVVWESPTINYREVYNVAKARFTRVADNQVRVEVNSGSLLREYFQSQWMELRGMDRFLASFVIELSPTEIDFLMKLRPESLLASGYDVNKMNQFLEYSNQATLDQTLSEYLVNYNFPEIFKFYNLEMHIYANRLIKVEPFAPTSLMTRALRLSKISVTTAHEGLGLTPLGLRREVAIVDPDNRDVQRYYELHEAMTERYEELRRNHWNEPLYRGNARPNVEGPAFGDNVLMMNASCRQIFH